MTQKALLIGTEPELQVLNQHLNDGWVVKFQPQSTFVSPTGRVNELANVDFVHGSFLVILEKDGITAEEFKDEMKKAFKPRIARATTQASSTELKPIVNSTGTPIVQ